MRTGLARKYTKLIFMQFFILIYMYYVVGTFYLFILNKTENLLDPLVGFRRIFVMG